MPDNQSNFTLPDDGRGTGQDMPVQGGGDNGQVWDPVSRTWVDADKAGGSASQTHDTSNAGFSQGSTYDAYTGMGTAGSAGKINDPVSWGGYSGTVVGDGNLRRIDAGASGRGVDVQRYQEKGKEMAGRQAYQLDYGKARQDMANALQARGQQGAASRALLGAAQGNAPSQAEMQGRMAVDQSLEGQLQAQASAKAGALSQASAATRAQAGAAAQGSGLASHFAAGRSGELARDRAGYTAGMNAMRGQDYTAQGMAQERAKAQAESEMAQRQMNQQGQIAYEDMAWNTNKAAQDASLTNQEIENNIYSNALKVDAQEKDRTMKEIGGGLSAGGVAASAYFNGAKNDGPAKKSNWWD